MGKPAEPAAGGGPQRPLAAEIAGTFGHFLRGQLVIAFLMAVYSTVAFLLIELPLWWLAGPIAGVLTLIPFVGFLVGLLIPLLIVLFAGAGPWAAVKVVLVMAAGQAIEGLILTPRILGRKLQLSPLLVFAVVLLGAVFFGPLGAFFAAPVAAVIMLLWRRSQSKPRGSA